MRRVKNLKNILIYSLLITPLLFIFLEIISGLLNQFVNQGKKNDLDKALMLDWNVRSDAISGWRICHKETNGNSINGYECNIHGLPKTPYEKTQTNPENNIGILISGNSVARGILISSIDNINTFAGQLEIKLRSKNKDIDVVNLADNGFSSWQEHAEISRYLNVFPLYDDLPEPRLIISFGGIQDFWNFLQLLFDASMEKTQDSYMQANGLMINKRNMDFLQKATESFQGNINASFQGLGSSIILNLRNKSEFIKLLNRLYSKSIEKINIFQNSSLLNRSTKNIYLRSLEEVVSEKLSMELNQYNLLKNYIIDTVIRNLNATSVISDNKFIFAYAPNYFNTKSLKSKDEFPLISSGNNEIRQLNELDIHLIETDYRKTLLKKLRNYTNMIVFDYSQKANDNWFLDYSHFNEAGSAKIAELMANDILRILSIDYVP